MKKFDKSNNLCNIFLRLLFLIKFLFSNSQILNNIIKLGDYPFKYNHFSYNSNGDLIIDTDSSPSKHIKIFYGIKKDGQEYFIDNLGNKNYYYSMNINYEIGRVLGESCFIKIKENLSNTNWKEFLLGISKSVNSSYKTEIYDLDNKNIYGYLNSDLFGSIRGNIFSIIPSPLNSNTEFNYFISYIANSSLNIYKLYTIKANFYFNNYENIEMKKEKMDEINSVGQGIISCFFTENNLYICFYTKDDLRLTIWAFDPEAKQDEKTYIYTFYKEDYRRFYKGIHLKNEIGFFTYFKNDGIKPYFSLYEILSNKIAKIYKSYNDITFSGSYTNIDLLNDIIKLNDNMICFVGSSYDMKKINIITFIFYSSYDYMNARFYIINMYEEKKLKFYANLKLSSFNNFLLIAFSHYGEKICDKSDNNPCSSLIFFSYPNSSDINLDIIEYILPSNKNIENDILINFEESLIIENNIFGLELKGTKILNYSDDIILIKDENNIEPGTIIKSGDTIQLKFKANDFYPKGKYNIKYAFVLTEPDYEKYNKKVESIYQTYGNDKKNEKEYFQKNEFIGKTSNFIAIISENLQTKCFEEICSLCYSNKNKSCITCLYDFDYNKNSKIKTCYNSSEEINTSNILILTGKHEMKITNEQLQTIYNEMKSQIGPNKSQIIETENVIFQISSLDEQKNNENPNISSIELGECEDILKNNSGLSENEDLIIYKVDIKNKDLSQTYVQYEIYDPKTLNIISLDACKDIPIFINVPVNLNENTRSIYSSLNQYGYNLFDLNDKFYNDICSPYTTENGTDLTLADRKNLIYDVNGDITMCQQGCTLNKYNLTTGKSQCDCFVQKGETVTNMDKINFEDDSSIKDEFFDTLKNSNFRVLKCFKLILSIKGQKNNIGSYIMSGLYLIFIILILVYIFKENYKLNFFLAGIIQQKLDYINENKAKGLKSENDIEIFNKNINPKKKKIKSGKKNKKRSTKNKNKSKEKIKRGNDNNKSSEILFPPRRKQKNIINKENLTFKTTFDKLNSKQSKTLDKIKNENDLINLNSKKNKIKTMNKNVQKIQNSPNSNLNKNIKDLMFTYKIEELNDEEINNLNYEIALILDKRTYFQYYFSLLKKKQLILFAFYPNQDYNLLVVKISLLILSFSLYFTINGFFFTDETMNKINNDHGKFDIFYQIPQLLYSTLISSSINFILKLLSLSEKQILIIKQEKNLLNVKKRTNNIIKYLKIKLAFFFVLSFLFMLFFWYFISCFCTVYKNTQNILIIDTLISFALSMIYPFVINFIPGFLRIPSLRANSKDRKYLYILSGYIALI